MKNRLTAILIAAGTAVSAAQAQTSGSGSAGSFELGVEGIAVWFRDSPMSVPLVTNLIVGAPATQTYLGGEDLSVGTTAGARVAGTYFLDDRMTIEGNFLFVPERSTRRGVSSSGEIGSIDLIVPYFDAISNQENGTEISFAPIYGASATEKYTAGMLGAEVNAALSFSPSPDWGVDAFGGSRYLRLKEELSFRTSSPYIAPFPAGVWDTRDEFETTNSFFGVQAGFRGRYDRGALFATTTLKIAAGAMKQSVDIRGSLETDEFTGDGTTQTFSGGYFALPSNIGEDSRTRFAVVPELDVRVGYRITPALSVLLGYQFVYASRVVRPGDQIDRTVNTTQSTAYTDDPTPTPVGPERPAFAFHESRFWAQGASLGLAYRF